ncbi:MAG: nicotinate (nicotinamide) nucleotide adenylyltransferase [Clostridiales bacterium]|nr:nicotinate (nicotinamide) nucleotide adenylyltransferase [Clostridiales bacterium]
MKNIAIFGGSFNPIHNGHINLVTEIQYRYKFEKILIIPTYSPPHKSTKSLVSAEHRFNMCKLATEHSSHLIACDIEIKRKGKSYTFDTLTAIKEIYPEHKMNFIMGADMLYSFTSWYKYRDIAELATIIVAARKKDEYHKLMEKKAMLSEIGINCHVENIDVVDISSTEIREFVLNGNYSELRIHVPKKVASYIIDNELYV